MIRRPPRSTLDRSSAASDVYKRQDIIGGTGDYWGVFKILKNDGSGNFSFVGGPYLGPHPDELAGGDFDGDYDCLLYTSPSPRDRTRSRMPSSA